MKNNYAVYPLLLIFTIALVTAPVASGQTFGKTTVGEELSKATSTINDLKTARGQLDLNLGIDAKVDAHVNVTADALIQRLDGLVNSLKDSLKNDFAKPIQGLSDSLRES